MVCYSNCKHSRQILLLTIYQYISIPNFIFIPLTVLLIKWRKVWGSMYAKVFHSPIINFWNFYSKEPLTMSLFYYYSKKVSVKTSWDILQGYCCCLRRFYEGIIKYFEASNRICIWLYKFVAANYPLCIRNFFCLAVSDGFIFLWRLPQTSLSVQRNIYHAQKVATPLELKMKKKTKFKSTPWYFLLYILTTWNQKHHFTQHQRNQ